MFYRPFDLNASMRLFDRAVFYGFVVNTHIRWSWENFSINLHKKKSSNCSHPSNIFRKRVLTDHNKDYPNFERYIVHKSIIGKFPTGPGQRSGTEVPQCCPEQALVVAV